MAHVRERKLKDGTSVFNVRIRIKGFNYTEATFNNKSDAILWVKYKEDLLNAIREFEPKNEELVTLETAINLKLQDAIKNNLSANTINALRCLGSHFADIINLSLSEITYDRFLNLANRMIGTRGKRGGDGKGKGKDVNLSPQTIFSRLRTMSSVYSFMQDKGLECENIPLKVLQYIRNEWKNVGDDE